MTYEAFYLVGEMISSASLIEGLEHFYNAQWGEITMHHQSRAYQRRWFQNRKKKRQKAAFDDVPTTTTPEMTGNWPRGSRTGDSVARQLAW